MIKHFPALGLCVAVACAAACQGHTNEAVGLDAAAAGAALEAALGAAPQRAAEDAQPGGPPGGAGERAEGAADPGGAQAEGAADPGGAPAEAKIVNKINRLLPQEVRPIPTMGDAAAALGEPPSRWDMGEPLAMDAALLESLRGVRADPGSLPRLQVQVGPGQVADLPLRHTHVKAELTGYEARVEVTQRYKNPFEIPIEAVYVFPLPENSAVDDMRMVIGQREIRAAIERRAEARHVYEEARRAGHTAALLEQERPNVFTQSVANIAPGGEIEVVIRYVQSMTYDNGQIEFVFPMVVGPRFIPGDPLGGPDSGGGWARDTAEVPDASRITPLVVGGGMRAGQDISLELVAEAGLPIRAWEVPTHDVLATSRPTGFELTLAQKDEVPNRDFVLRYRLAGAAPQVTLMAHRVDGEQGAFALMVQPPSLDLEALVGQRELIFVVDVSGSMSGLPLVMCQDAMRRALGLMRPADTFNVVTFANGTHRVFDKPRPASDANVRAALDAINRLSAGGGTQMLDAVDEALSPSVEPGRHRYVFFLTDGFVGNEAQIIASAGRFVARTREGGGARARVFGFGVGSSPNRALLDGLAVEGDGISYVSTSREDPAVAVSKFFAVIDHPVMTGIKIDWGGLAVTEVAPTRTSDLFASRPLVVRGRYRKPGKGKVVVTGMVGNTRVRIPVEVELPAVEARHAALATLWARERIGELERELWEGPKKKIEAEITELGLAHRIVTAYTSLVAVDRSKKVSDGAPLRIDQPVDAPEGVAPEMTGGCIGCQRPMGFGSAPNSSLNTLSQGGVGGVHRGGGSGGMGYGVGSGSGALGGRGASAPQVRVSNAEVSGSLDPQVVVRVIRQHQARIRRVYEAALKSNPSVSGKIVVEVVLDADGKVKRVTIKSDTIKDPKIAQGVIAVFKQMRFPPLGGGVDVTFQFPLIFNNTQ